MPGRSRGSAGPAVIAGMVIRALEGMPPGTASFEAAEGVRAPVGQPQAKDWKRGAVGADTGWLENCSTAGGSSR